MRNNNTSHVVRLSKEANHSLVLSAAQKTHASNSTQHHRASKAKEGVFGKIVAMLLVPLILIYPLAPVYAEEVATTSEPVASEPNPPAVPDTAPVTPPSGTDSLVSDLGSAVSGALGAIGDLFSTSSTTEGNTPNVSTEGDATTTTTENQQGTSTTGEEEASTTPSLGDASSTPETTDTSTSTPPQDASSTPATEGNTATSTEGVTGVDSGSHETASTTDSTATSTEEVVATKTPEEIAKEMLAEREDAIRASIRKEVEDEFTKGCVTLDTTGYYCLKDRANSTESLTPSDIVTEVTSVTDASSQNKQIFMTRGGVSEQLTHSTWDNAFPTTDVAGRNIVWQGNVSGRWQIFYANAHGTSTPNVIQLTHSNDSNFNPKVDGNDVVWQGWVGGNWEIFLAERLSPETFYPANALPPENNILSIDNTWKVTRITTNGVHDMFPAVAGGLVTWQSFQDNAWNVYVYSIKTGGTQKISSSGEKSEKPRFAITWDERTPSGDARMVGYDIATGKTIDITNEARQVNDQKAPYTPSAPISQPDQAALPGASVTGANTNMKDDSGGGDGGDNGLPV